MDVESPEVLLDLLALDEALQKLERQSPRKAELVKLRYFAGLNIEQAAQALGVAPSTAAAGRFKTVERSGSCRADGQRVRIVHYLGYFAWAHC